MNRNRLRSPKLRWSSGLVLAAVIVAAVLPLVTPPFWISVMIEILILGLFAMSFNLLFGYTGMLSFGHAAYYGAGAYGVAILMSGPIFVPTIASFPLAFLLAIALGTGLAVIFGAICVQRGDLSFAILTLAFNMLLYEIVFQWNDLTGGDDGVIMSPPPVDFGLFIFDPLSQQSYYYFVLVIVLVSLWVLWRIVNSPYGELLKAIRENSERASFNAIPVKYYQWSAFVISGVFASTAGALASVQTYVISPGVVHWGKSAEPVIISLLGGPSVFLGPIIGAFMFVGLEEILTDVTQYWQFGLGIVLVLIVLYLPGGVAKATVDWIRQTTVFTRLGIAEKTEADR